MKRHLDPLFVKVKLITNLFEFRLRRLGHFWWKQEYKSSALSYLVSDPTSPFQVIPDFSFVSTFFIFYNVRPLIC